jgi:hypothetical protein
MSRGQRINCFINMSYKGFRDLILITNFKR